MGINDQSSLNNSEPPRGCFDPRGTVYRYTVLLCACFLIFGNYFVNDLPGALSTTIKTQIHDPISATENGMMSQSTFNLLYSVYNFPNILLAMMGGIFVDRLGLRTGCFVFVTIILSGQAVVAVGATIKSYYVMLIGRVIFAIGGESCAVAQNAFVSRWFRDKDLALALGLALSLGRLGSGLNFLTSAQIASTFGDAGLSIAMWFGVILCGVSEIACLLLIMLDRRAEKMGVLEDPNANGEPEKISFEAVSRFPAEFWVICIIVVVFYSAVFPFNATAVGLLSDVHTNYLNSEGQPLYDETTAGYIVSIPSFLAVFLAPVMGRLVDMVGRRPMLIALASFGMACAHFLFALSYGEWQHLNSAEKVVLHPVLLILIYGLSYGLLAAALFPCTPLVIENMAFIGTAFGIIFSIQNGGLAAVQYLMGKAQDQLGHQTVEYCFASFGLLSMLLAFVLLFLDKTRSNILSSITKQKEPDVGLPLDPNIESETEQLLRREFPPPMPITRRSRLSYDFTDLPAASEVVGSHSQVRNMYLRKIGIVGLEGRMRSASAI